MSDLDQALAPAPPAVDACQAVDAILCSARGFERLDAWRQPLSERLQARLSPQRRAALLQRCGLIALLRDGDVVAAGQQFAQAIGLLEPDGPSELLLALRAQAGIADCLAGRGGRAAVQLTDAELGSRESGFSVPARGWLEIALALNCLLRSDAAGALEVLAGPETASPDEGTAGLLRLELALYAAALLGHRNQVTALSGHLALALIPRRLTLLEAGRHFVLGVAALRQGEALRALVHAEEGSSAGARAGARLALLLSGLLRAQALADLQRVDEARQLLQQLGPDWSCHGLNHLAAIGQLELAQLEANAGEQDRARQALAAARALLPVGEPLPSGPCLHPYPGRVRRRDQGPASL